MPHRYTEPRGYRKLYYRGVVPTDTPTKVRIKRLTLDLPAELHRALKVRSAELDVPMVELLRTLIERYLEDAQAQGPTPTGQEAHN